MTLFESQILIYIYYLQQLTLTLPKDGETFLSFPNFYSSTFSGWSEPQVKCQGTFLAYTLLHDYTLRRRHF